MRFFLFSVLLTVPLLAQTANRPARAVTDPGIITTRQNITPAGVQNVFQGRVYGITFGASHSELWVLTSSHVYQMDWQGNRVLEQIALAGSPGLQGIRYDRAAGRAIVSRTSKQRGASVQISAIENKSLRELGSWPGALAGALAVSEKPNAKGQRLGAAPLVSENRLALVDLAGGQTVGTVDTGKAPFGVVLDAAGTVAYVSNWGGRVPRPGDLTAPTGHAPNSDRVVVDKRGIASTGTVTRIDLASSTATHSIPVGLHPTALASNEAQNRLYVANGNEDSVSVIDTKDNRVIQTFPVQPFPKPLAGIAPTALALGGARLYVACGGINAIVVLEAVSGRILGTIPTAWYPNGLAISPTGEYLAVSTLLGVGSGWSDEPRKRYVHAYRGSVSIIPTPDEGQLASYTTAVAENNHVRLAASVERSKARVAPVAIPRRAGEPSLIEHVVYVIKENRTYDQVFGDVPKGNGDPSLVMFGAGVTPNHHRLAEQFVLFDNFYATGGNSGDGHQWLTQANETDYCLWPGYVGRSYPFDGTDPIAYSKNGFIWDAALRMKKTVRVYGEYAGRLNERNSKQRADLLERWQKGGDFTHDWNTVAPLESLNPILAKNYPPYSTAIPDVARAQIFLTDVKQWVASGQMPNLVIVQLPSDHTRGTAPGTSSPKAMVADNDLALGQIVEALTGTPFWKKMAIFVVEDDAQNGVDHVDGHRTVALIASPYARRGYVDSTFYSQPSILKTIELIFGLPSLSLFDLIANSMSAAFINEPDFSRYKAVNPEQSLLETNPPLSALSGAALRAARDSMKMRFETPDAAPTERLNRILWHQIRGWNTPYPGVKTAAFAPLSLDLDDDER